MSARQYHQRSWRDPYAAGGSPGSRNIPIYTAYPMPPIAEDEDNNSNPAYYRTPSGIIMPRTPLRVPQKSLRRSAAPAPPPYAPQLQHLPPQYKEAPSSTASSSDTGASFSELKKEQALAAEARAEVEKIGWRKWLWIGVLWRKSARWVGKRNRRWFDGQRGKWLRLLGLVLLAVAMIVTLVVGLTVGLRGTNTASDEDSTDTNYIRPQSSKPTFPAGTYSFETTLQKAATSCTTDPATWRCFPYMTGASATFYWIITESDDNNSSYTVSANENPYNMPFTNLSATLLDANRSDERLVFEFDMDKTITPDTKTLAASNNETASCTFSKTKFQATLWTKPRGSNDTDTPDVDTKLKFGPWPGDVEIVETKSVDTGDLNCVDAAGDDVDGVKAGGDDCTCDYASFQLTTT